MKSVSQGVRLPGGSYLGNVMLNGWPTSESSSRSISWLNKP